jgi:hypothetical protein
MSSSTIAHRDPASSGRCLDYAVTFEYDDLPPQTVRGTVRAVRVCTSARMAVQAAAAQLHPCRWRSVVVLLTGA